MQFLSNRFATRDQSLLLIFLLASLVDLGWVRQAEAQEKGKRAPYGTYLGRRIAPAMTHLAANWLIRGERESEEDPTKLLNQLDLKPGMIVCDMGCGNGFYSLKMAQAVAPNGRVLAVDIQPEMLQLLSRRSIEAKVDNIDMILGTTTDPKLPENEIDLLLMVDVYHEFSDPEAMLKKIRNSLKPTGRIALAEFREEDASVPIKPEHKMSKKQILKEYEANGFQLLSEYDGLPWQHLMFLGPKD
jgi:ubiquinone/menaquinone biosynthesis C-methylase UbiE